MKYRASWASILVRAVVGLLPCFFGAAMGQTYTWSSGVSGNWSDLTNWDSSGAPISSPTSIIQINATDPAAFTLTNDLGIAPLVLNAFMLNSSSTAAITVLSPDPFQLGGTAPNITLNGSGAVVFQSSAATPGAIFDVTNAMSIGGSGTGTLTIGGATDNNVFSGAGAVTVNFTTPGNAAAPNLLLGDVANWSGALNVQSGYVKANRTAGDLFGEITIVNVAAGATLDMSNNGEAFGGLQGAGTVVLGSAGLTFDAPGDRTWTGNISGTGGVGQAGGGVFTMGGTNTYSGTTTISGGTIRAAAANSLSPNSAITLTAGQGVLDLNGLSQTIAGIAGGSPNSNLALGSSTLTINGSGTGIRVFNGFVSGTGNLVIGGTATQIFLGNNTYIGTTTVNGGVLRVNGAGLLSGGGVSIGDAGTLDASFAADATWGVSLSGTGIFAKSGIGNLTLAAGNASANFTGVTVNAGTLTLDSTSDNGSKLGVNPALSLASGGLTLLGNSASPSIQTYNGLSLAGAGKLSIASGINQNSSIAFGSLTRRVGSTINFGLTNNGSGIASISTTATNGSTGILGGYATVNGTDWAVTGTGAGPFNIAVLPAGSYASNTWSPGTHTDVTSSFAIANAGSTSDVRFNTAAASTLTLVGANSVATGGILVSPNVGANASTISGGSLTAPAGQELLVNQFNTLGNLTISSVIANTTSSTSQTIATITANATISGLTTTTGLYPGMLVTGTGIAANARILSINSPTSITLTSTPTAGSNINLTFAGGTALTKSGPGTLTLSGTNTLTGSLILNEGALSVGVIGNIGASATDVGSNSIYFNGGTLRMTGSIAPGSGIQPWIIGPAGGTVDVVGSNTSASKQGNSVFGSGTLTKVGDGIFSVGSNVSTFSGLININQGIIRLTSNQLRNSTGMTVANGAQLYILDTPNGPFSVAANASLVLNGDGPGGTGAYRHSLDEAGSSNFGWSSAVYLQTTSRLNISTDGTLSNRTPTDTIVDNFPAPITGPGNLIKDGNGTLVLGSAFNAYGGSNGSTILSNGTLRIGGSDRLPTSTTLQFGENGSTNSGIFDLNGFNQTVAGLSTLGSGAGHQIVNNGANASTLTVNYSGTTPQTFAGAIVGTGNTIGLVKGGSGTLSLTGSTTYTGPTTVSGGTLRVFGNTIPRPYTVADGAGLSVVNQDPTTPFAISSLSLGNAGTSNLGFELSSTTPTTGLINVSDFNGLTTNGAVNVSVSSVQTLSVGQFPLMTYAGSIAGSGFGAFSAGSLTLPSRVLGTLVDDIANSSIDLKVTGVDFIKWTGAADGNWNINSTSNWKLNATNLATNYLEASTPGDTVVFDESAGGTHSVNLTTTLTPSSVTVSGPSDYTFTGAGKLNGTTGLTKSGAGTLTVLTNNTNTGPTTITGGTLQIGNGGTTGSLGSGNVTNDGSIVFNRSDDVTIAANFAGGGTLTKSGTNTLTLTGSYGLTGNTTISAGALALNGGGAYSGNIGGAGALTKGGVGTLVLTGAANPGGGTNIAGGTLQIGDGNTAGTLGGNVTLVTGSTLAFNRADDSAFAGSITGAGGVRNLGTGKTTLTGPLNYTGQTVVAAGTLEFGSATDTTLNAAVTGTGTLIKSGAGQLTLLNSNTFSGPLIVNGGTVLLDDQGASGDLNSSSITINNGGKFIFGNTPGSNPDLPDTTFITVTTGGEFELRIGEQWGATRLAGGTFRFTSNNANVGATSNATSGDFTGYALESGAIIANTGTGAGSFSRLAGSSLAMTKTTPGTVTFSGKISIATDMPINILEGALAFDPNNIPASGTGVVTLGDVATTGIFRLTGPASASTSKSFFINSGGGAIDVSDPAAILTLSNNLMSGNGNLSKTGPGTLNTVAQNSFTGITSVDAGALRISTGFAAGGFNVANGAKLIVSATGASPGTLSVPSLSLGTTNSTIAFELDSPGNPVSPLLTIGNADSLLTNGGTHTLSIIDSQSLAVGQFPLISYTGAPITSGFGLGALPSRTNASLVYNTANSSVDLNVLGLDSTVWNGNLSANWDAGAAVDVGGTKNFKLASNGTATNFFTADRITFDDTAAGTFAVNLTTAVQPGSVTVNNDVNNYTFQGPGSIAGPTGLTKQGAATLIVLTDNTFTGQTSIANGTLQLGNGGTTGSVTSNIDVAFGANLAFNRSDNFIYNGKLSGSGSINKTGAGTLTLGGSSTAYFGALTIDQGTVLLDDLGGGGDLNAVSIVVNNGASFVFGENGNADLPDSTVVTVNAGGVFDLKQGENFGGVILKGGTFQMTGGTRTGVNATAFASIGYVLQSGTVTTNFTGAASGGVLGGASFLDKTTPDTVNITGGVTFNDALSINIREGTLAMGAANFPVTGTTTVTLGDFGTHGTLQVTDVGSVSTVRPFAIADGGGTLEIAQPAALVTLAGPISGTGTFTKAGPGVVTIAGTNTYTGPTVVSGGTLRVTSSIATSSSVTINTASRFETPVTQTINTLTINDGGKLDVTATASGNPRTVLTIIGDSPTVLGAGMIDVHNNALIFDYADTSPITSIRTLIANGKANGWVAGATPSIGSAEAAAGGSKFAIGYAEASSLNLPAGFLGQPVDTTSVLVRYTLAGDTDLDGTVGFADLVKVAQNYGADLTNPADPHFTNNWWATGDFNYDGHIDFADLVTIAQNYGGALPSLPLGSAAFEADLAAASSVPEPSTMTLLAIAMSGILLKRRVRAAA